MDITKIQALQQQLAPYHGSLLLSHITNLEQKDLLDVFGSTYENLTVTKARQRLLDNLSAESVALQFKNFQKALEDGIITR